MEESDGNANAAPHDALMLPGSGSRSAAAPASMPPSVREKSNAALTVAILWAIVAVIVGLKFITGTEDGEYGGDAYTDIQNTGAQTVRALGWVIISTGPLGLVTALSRH